jgi:hypothetical protein
MILHRFTKHVTEQNWFPAFIELILIILGVFIGLQANSWNEERIAKVTTQSYYERLIEDLQTEETMRVHRIAYNASTLKHGESVIDALNQSIDNLGAQFLIDLYQASQIWPYTPQRTTYDEIISGNIADTIPDIKLRNKLANYYLNLEAQKVIQGERTSYRNNLRRYMQHEIQKFIRENCGDITEYTVNNIEIGHLPEECELKVDPIIISNAVSKLSSYKNLELDLTRHLADVEQKIVSLKYYIPATRELIKYLEELQH